MLNIKDLSRAIKQVAEEKSLEPERIIEAIESSIAAAYKKEYGTRGEIIKAKVDMKTGELHFWQVKVVVDETTVRMEAKEGEGDAESEASKLRATPHEETENEEPVLPRYNPDR